MPVPRCRILSIGDELLLGRIADTNAAWIARWAWDLGLRVEGSEQVGDGQAAIVAALRRVAETAELVVMTGGLGPTEDDRTRHALAEALGRPLRRSAVAERQIRTRWARLRPGAPLAEANLRQALVPAGAAVLANPAGTAPGIRARLGGARILCLPGVPQEMRTMLTGLAGRLPALLPGLRPPAVGEVWLAGAGESEVQALIPGLLREADPMVGITVQDEGHLVLRAVGTSAQVRRALAAARRPLAALLLPAPGVAASVVAELARRRARIACAESCTGGRIAAALTAVPGCSAVLGASWVCYDAAAKTALGVDPALIRLHGAVSEAVAVAMAESARRAAGVDIGLATTGIAGPGGGTPSCPVGTVCVACAGPAGTEVRRLALKGDRSAVLRRATQAGLLLAWAALRRPVRVSGA
jgi:nicotinamide-nucleotide amidase